MILAQWRARRASKALIEQIRGEIVAAARRPELYEALAAPDRMDGRFELLTVHAGLVLRRLAALGGVADAIAQDLVDSLFTHFDDTLREIGYSDIGVSKRLKAMGSAFYGRNAAYAAALDDASPHELATALARNVYGAKSDQAGSKAEALARYIASLDAGLSAIPLEAFTEGRFRFPLVRSQPEFLMSEGNVFSRIVRVDTLPRDGKVVSVEATSAEREELASFYRLPDIAVLTATLSLKPLGRDGVRVTGAVHGELTQLCIVSVEPFPATVDEEVDVQFAPQKAAKSGSPEETFSLTDEDEPDPIIEGKIDLGALTAEFFALGLDPYPRKPGAAFEEERMDSEPADSPFAALAQRDKADHD